MSAVCIGKLYTWPKGQLKTHTTKCSLNPSRLADTATERSIKSANKRCMNLRNWQQKTLKQNLSSIFLSPIGQRTREDSAVVKAGRSLSKYDKQPNSKCKYKSIIILKLIFFFLLNFLFLIYFKHTKYILKYSSVSELSYAWERPISSYVV